MASDALVRPMFAARVSRIVTIYGIFSVDPLYIDARSGIYFPISAKWWIFLILVAYPRLTAGHPAPRMRWRSPTDRDVWTFVEGRSAMHTRIITTFPTGDCWLASGLGMRLRMAGVGGRSLPGSVFD